jgi:conjugal transfer ATP-binding protein TraC
VLKAIDDGLGGVHLYHQLVTFAPAEQANFCEHAVKALYTSKGWELQNDAGVQMQALLCALPLTLGKGLVQEMGNFGRLSTKTTRNAANLMPAVAEWLGTGTPTLMLLGRRGQIQFVDVFDKLGQGGNYNVAIAARSGSGKSVLLNEIAFSYRGTDSGRGPGRVWIIDVGRSYERTCHLAGGQFVEFSEAARLCLNPFTYLRDDNNAAFEEQVGELKPIIAQMAAPSRRTDDLENAWIEQAIHAAWEAKRNAASITDVAAWLIAHEHTRAQELGQMLYPYTRDGVHGRFFDGEANLEFDNDFIVLELEELKSKPDLQAVVLQTVMSRINQAVYLGREDGRRKLLMIDEAWDLFGTGENAGKFIETAARRIRKYGGSLLTATQGVNDYYKTPASQAAFDNSDWLFLLAQKKESIEQLERSGRLSMDAHMKRTLTSINTVSGQYAEVMVVGPQGYSVGRLVLDPYSNALYSTTNEDFIRIKELMRQGLSTAEAIDRLLVENGGGVR